MCSCRLVLLLAIGAATHSALAGRFRSAPNSTNEKCIESFNGNSTEAKCQALLNTVNFGLEASALKELLNSVNLGITSMNSANLMSEYQDAVKKSKRPPVTEPSPMELGDDACSEVCDEPHTAVVGHDGVFNKVHCCKTVYKRLAYYKYTKERCADQQYWETPCWHSLDRTLPGHIEHYKGLAAKCDSKCK
eukprot:gnl/TRDRNA2_/TRDRNA2_182149_c0_seq1.p1 gnl/TRDRNA2_/TRDRNA2_182149_c0~~gnl/TRDRNA2_/TRDRNA2_182149_c0_seq1.p1  ORF type:complete len:191 (+),score=40.41 gnl/TRDRNA2_/TRDRNA2_182149_c0_seq1:73-645(+)